MASAFHQMYGRLSYACAALLNSSYFPSDCQFQQCGLSIQRYLRYAYHQLSLEDLNLDLQLNHQVLVDMISMKLGQASAITTREEDFCDGWMGKQILYVLIWVA